MNQDEYAFTMPHGYALKDLKRVQMRLLDMARITTSILEKHKINYFLAFGTLLGAVRHHGFIPWDDDFDLFLFEDEYEEALRDLRSELPSDLIVHDQKTDSSYYAAWSKIRDLKSSVVSASYPSDNEHKYTGINLDLYKLVRVPRKYAEVWRRREAIEFLVRKYDVGLLDESEYDLRFSDWTHKYVDAFERIKQSPKGEDKVFAFQLVVTQLEVADVLPLKRYDFEGFKFWGPANYDAFLRQGYGDYMTIPPFEKRRPHCDAVSFML